MLIKTLKQISLIVFITLFVGGCAVFPGKNLPELDKLPDRSQFKNKPSVALDVKSFMDTSAGKNDPVENAQNTIHLKTLVDKVTRESDLFSRYSLDPADARSSDYTIKIEVIERSDMGPAMVGAVITGLSLYIIPSKVSVDFVLNARVLDRDGRELAKYQLNDDMTMWQGLIFIPFPNKSIIEGPRAIVANMVKNLYQQILNDKLLKYSAIPPLRDNVVAHLNYPRFIPAH